jgi:glucose/mannose transport system permease protein
MGGLLFVLPSIIVVLIFVYGLIAWSVNVSLTNQNSGRKKEIDYVGLKNYTDLLTDERFTHSLENLVKFTVVFILGALVTGFIMALLLESRARAFFAPSIYTQWLSHLLRWEQFLIGYLTLPEMKRRVV